MTPADLEAVAFRHMPEDFFRRALDAVFMAHRVADEECRALFAETEAQNVRPYVRRGKLEGYLRDVAALVPTLSATVLQAPNSNWWHTEVRGGPVVLTENAVQKPCAMVDKAEFRVTLAENNQLSFWEDARDDEPDALYVLLLHSRSVWPTGAEQRTHGYLPGSCYVAFPAPGFDSYIHAMNLFEKFPDVVRKNTPEQWDADALVRFVARARKTA